MRIRYALAGGCCGRCRMTIGEEAHDGLGLLRRQALGLDSHAALREGLPDLVVRQFAERRTRCGAWYCPGFVTDGAVLLVKRRAVLRSRRAVRG